jgi:hypothetical protein
MFAVTGICPAIQLKNGYACKGQALRDLAGWTKPQRASFLGGLKDVLLDLKVAALAAKIPGLEIGC